MALEEQSKISRRKIVLLVILFIVLVILGIFGFNIYLLYNFLTGNDVMISSTADNENLFLKHGESANVNFNLHISTNPFCRAECTLNFQDLSSGTIINTEVIKLAPPQPINKKVTLTAKENGIGQDLYRLDAECKTTKSILCYSGGEIKTRSILITLNYNLTDEEQGIKQDSKNKIAFFSNELGKFDSKTDPLSVAFQEIKKTTNIKNMDSKINDLEKSITDLNSTIFQLIYLWENQNYLQLEPRMKEIETSLLGIANKFSEINSSISSNISAYNSVILNLSNIKSQLEILKQQNTSEQTHTEIEKAVTEFNRQIDSFSSPQEISIRLNDILNLTQRITLINQMINDDISSGLALNFNSKTAITKDIHLLPISINDSNIIETPIILKEPEEICCLYGKCQPCCNSSCSSDSDKYPIIFLHGHDFNRQISAEYSLDYFDKMQRALEQDGYLNAGTILIGNPEGTLKGIWGKNKIPLSFKASYYFDLFQSSDTNQIIEQKKDNINTYAIRLRDVIDTVKQKTGRDKVIIMTQSMGGLVARKYIQLFGEDSVDKMILIVSPNHGVEGFVKNYCDLYGAALECEDLSKDSLFLNRLNNGAQPTIPIYNIIGTGCIMGSETGDGIVKNSSAYLDIPNAQNIYVSGVCEEYKLRFFHTEVLDIDRYPDVYEKVKEGLKFNGTNVE